MPPATDAPAAPAPSTATAKEPVLNKFSRILTQPKQRGISQAMLYATGMTEEDMNKAQVGITAMAWDGNPCNMHLGRLADEVKKAVSGPKMIGLRFYTIGVSDGISMGTDGMSYSLQSRDIIADSIETVMSAQYYDGLIAIPGCDKNMPGCIMAIGRLNRPALCVYGGTIRAGCTVFGGKKQARDIVSAAQSYGEAMEGTITEEQRKEIVRKSCPGAGACGGMYTANTMASAIEALGMSLPYSSSIPAEDPAKLDECRQAAAAIQKLLELDLKPSDIMTREAFENAMVVVTATGGSTNAVLHLIAMARSVGVDLTIDDFQTVSDRVPFLADLKPSGKYVMEDLHAVGGTPGLMRYLLAHGFLNGDCMTVTGKTLAQNLASLPGLREGQDVIRPLDNPIKSSGHIQILYGNLSPEGAVAKITGKEGLKFTGVAKCYDCEEDMLAGMERHEIKKGMVIVIRYEGPKGGPGMPEMLTPTSLIMGAGMAKDVALVTDGRFSGGSHGFIIGHVTPEAQEGGPIAVVQDGDIITVDAETRTLTIDNIDDEELALRQRAWEAPPLKKTRGTLYKYIKNVKSASEGCVTDE